MIDYKGAYKFPNGIMGPGYKVKEMGGGGREIERARSLAIRERGAGGHSLSILSNKNTVWVGEGGRERNVEGGREREKRKRGRKRRCTHACMHKCTCRSGV